MYHCLGFTISSVVSALQKYKSLVIYLMDRIKKIEESVYNV